MSSKKTLQLEGMTCGHCVASVTKELEKVAGQAHMEQVAFLKTQHEMGHGHANAVVAVFRTNNP